MFTLLIGCFGSKAEWSQICRRKVTESIRLLFLRHGGSFVQWRQWVNYVKLCLEGKCLMWSNDLQCAEPWIWNHGVRVVKRSASPLSPFQKRGSSPLFQDAPLWWAGLTCGGKPILMEGCTPFAERCWLSVVTTGVGVHCRQYLLRASSGKSWCDFSTRVPLLNIWLVVNSEADL